MSDVWVIEHGSDPRPARVTKAYITADGKIGSTYVQVEFTDARGGKRRCLASSVFHTRAEAVRAEREMEAVDKLAQGEQGRDKTCQ